MRFLILLIIFLGTSLLNQTFGQGVSSGDLLEDHSDSITLNILPQTNQILEKADFNKGIINDPLLLIQGRIAGVQTYNRGGNPNTPALMRIRGISSLLNNSAPLFIVDGVPEATLENLDPYDILSFEIIKDAAQTAEYGIRGGAGVVKIRTNSALAQDTFSIQFAGQTGIASPSGSLSVLSSDAFRSANGADLGSNTDWIEEVTCSGLSHNQHLALSFFRGKTGLRWSGTHRFTEGVMLASDLESWNSRLHFTTQTNNEKLTLHLRGAYTRKDQNLAFNEGLRYAVNFNPTAPVFGNDVPFEFDAERFGGYYENIGLFDSFNPVSLLNQNTNERKSSIYNLSLELSYEIATDWNAQIQLGNQSHNSPVLQNYPGTSLFRGYSLNPQLSGQFYYQENDRSFDFIESSISYAKKKENWSYHLSTGIAYQAFSENSDFYQFLGTANNLDSLEVIFQDPQNGLSSSFFYRGDFNRSSYTITSYFNKMELNLNNGWNFTANIRYDQSTSLGTDMEGALFYGLSTSADLKNLFKLSSLEDLTFRIGYGKSGSIPRSGTFARPASGTINGIPLESRYGVNPDLKRESNSEINVGIAFNTGHFSATANYYQKNVSGLIGSIFVDPNVFGADLIYDNNLDLKANGMEWTLDYNWVKGEKVQYKSTLLVSTFSNKITDYIFPEEFRANPGAPGNGSTNLIKVKIDDPVGDFWWRELDGVSPDGTPIFANDGAFTLLGNGLPKLELGMSHQLQWKKWNFDLFFRGAFGHSLFNIHRGFYEGAIPGNFQLFFNLVNTRLAIPELTANRFSSHHVEKANFLTLDNMSISREVHLGSRTLVINLMAQNLFTITNYTGFTPEPALLDIGSSDNGGFSFYDEADLLSPGMDRRNQYMPSRMVSLGIVLHL